MLTNFEFWNFIIAVIALIAAIYAILYSHFQDRILIDISDVKVSQFANDPFLVCFTIQNLSNHSIKLIGLSLKPSKGENLNIINGFKPTQTYSSTGGYAFSIPDVIDPVRYAKHFQTSENIQPNSEIDFRYYANPIGSELLVSLEIETNSFIKKTRTINSLVTLHFDN